MTEDILPGGELAGICGWDADGPHKLNLLFGIYGVLNETIINNSASAGDNDLNGNAVPAGEIWVVTIASIVNVDHNTTYPQLNAVQGSSSAYMAIATAGAALIPLIWSGMTFLTEGGYISGYLGGCSAGDHIRLRYSGYKMKIDP